MKFPYMGATGGSSTFIAGGNPGGKPPEVSSREQLLLLKGTSGDGSVAMAMEGVRLESFGPKLQLLPGNGLNPGGGQSEGDSIHESLSKSTSKAPFLASCSPTMSLGNRTNCFTTGGDQKHGQNGIMGLHHCNPKKVQYIHTSRGLNYH